MPATVRLGPTFQTEVADTAWWTLPTANDSSIDTGLVAWTQMQKMLDEGDYGGQLWTNPVASTYSLVYTNASGAYFGGILAANGEIHFVPSAATVGQKLSTAGVSSTYSLIVAGGYAGGVIAPNGDLHFVPNSATRGQKVSSTGTVSTYSLAYTTSGAYSGGVLAPNGDIHFVPSGATVGQKVSTAGVVSTYSLAYTVASAFTGGILNSDGDIILGPTGATRGLQLVTGSALPFDTGVCQSPFFNKY